MRPAEEIAHVRLKTSVPAAPYAADLLIHLLGEGRALLGAEPGAEYAETIAGHRFVAHRLRCGGVDVKECRAGTP